jgi:hypothetical protein
MRGGLASRSRRPRRHLRPVAGSLGVELFGTGATVNEANFTKPGEVPETDPTKSGTVTLNLQAGHCAIICNLAGHVAEGMVVGFTVQYARRGHGLHDQHR